MGTAVGGEADALACQLSSPPLTGVSTLRDREEHRTDHT